MSRSADERFADMLAAIERCQVRTPLKSVTGTFLTPDPIAGGHVTVYGCPIDPITSPTAQERPLCLKEIFLIF